MMNRLGWITLLVAYSIMNMLSLFPMYETLFCKIFFVLTSLGLFFLAYSCFENSRTGQRKKDPRIGNDWFMLSILMLCAYAVFDELIQRACIYNWWESLITIATFLFNYLTRNHRIWKSY